MEGQEFLTYDWDDSELIRAYNKGFEARMNKKGNKNGFQNKENKRRKWNVGDYCRALYSTDNLYYEAKIISLNGDFCTVEFCGYEETEDVDLLHLKETEGKKARRKQIKACLADSCDTQEESETPGNTTDGTVISRNLYRKKKSRVNQSALNTTVDTTMYEAACHQQYSAAPAPMPYVAPAPMPHVAPAPMPQYAPPMPANLPMLPPTTMPQYTAPFAPPMPMCPNLANNPALSSMLTSWYMAGYYTGIHSVQKENQGCQRCSHSNQCCRN